MTPRRTQATLLPALPGSHNAFHGQYPMAESCRDGAVRHQLCLMLARLSHVAARASHTLIPAVHSRD